ncbi:MAG: hypothetical protein V3R87_02025 [Dehalococcoidia bacterium]
MPYIKSKDKFRAMSSPAVVGELNYKITEACIDFIEENGGLSYTTVQNVIGVLECAKLELYRRVLAPYEDTKIAENGDVYPPELLPPSKE